MIKNCIFKSKLQDFLERASNRLIEKAFDKIKENNWNIEERKEILEEILGLRDGSVQSLPRTNRG
jgi:hypothetical protein